MFDYMTYKLSEAGISPVENIGCSCFIMCSDVDALQDIEFLRSYISRYGSYIGILFPRKYFDSPMALEDAKGILAFL